MPLTGARGRLQGHDGAMKGREGRKKLPEVSRPLSFLFTVDYKEQQKEEWSKRPVEKEPPLYPEPCDRLPTAAMLC